MSMEQEYDFIVYLDRCKTAEELFSPMTYVLLKLGENGQDADEQTQRERLDRVRDAAYAHKLPGVGHNLNVWLVKCGDEYSADPEAFRKKAMQHPLAQKQQGNEENAALPAPACMEDVAIQSVKWLVPGLLPLGEVSLLGADGGTGKGIWQAQLMAAVTTGQAGSFFPRLDGEPGRVLLFSGEDDPAKVLKARLLAAGADTSRVKVMTADGYFAAAGKPLTLEDKEFAALARKEKPQLIIVDPLQSFLPGRVEMASRNQMRSTILPFATLCGELGCAGLIVMHTNKKQGVAGRARLADSSDIWDMARCVLMMGRDKNSGQLYLSNEKNNYSARSLTTLLHIEDAVVEGVPTARAVYDGQTTRRDADFVQEQRVRTAQTREDTADAIRNVLAESRLGSMPSSQLRAEVLREVGCSDKTYDRAYRELVKGGEVSKRAIRKKDGTNQWFSSLAHCGGTNDQIPI